MSDTTPTLLADAIEYWARVTPDAEAIRYGDRAWTYAEWLDRVARASGALVEAGVRRGDRVALLDKNHPACLELTFAASRIGAMNAVINWRLAGDELVYVLNDCGASLLVVGAEFVPTLDLIRDQLTTVTRAVVLGGEHDEYDAMVSAAAPVAPDPEVRPDDPCVLLYSSGTTGYPKGVLLTHRGICAHTTALTEVFPFGPGDRNLVAMPLFHVGGTCYAMLGLNAGAPSTLTREPQPAILFEALAGGVTHAFLVPAVIGGILAAGEQAVAALRGITFLGYGAAPMPLPMLKQALRAWPDANLVQVYGMTELSGVATTLGPDDHRDESHPERLMSAGRPLAGVELRIVDPATDEDVPVGRRGEIWFRTDQRMAGYWGQPDATAATITPDGWVRSGDVGELDDAGYVYVVDRVKDMIISGGENIYSAEVERVIAEHPAVAETAVIGIPDEKWGESVRAVVAPRPGQAIDPDELLAFCRQRLAGYKVPRSIDVVEALPRNGAGKILKRDLRKPFWQGHARNVS